MSATIDTAIPADTPVARCAYYQGRGLRAAVQPDANRIVVKAGGYLGAVTMPAELGNAVRGHLRGRGLSPGPVISHPRSMRWTFLVIPDIPDEVTLFAEMFRLNVTVARPGAQIALPSPHPRSEAFRTWVVPPTAVRPSGLSVITAIREHRAGAGGAA
jgi:hypothetical protein